jgi:hypothetical protein
MSVSGETIVAGSQAEDQEEAPAKSDDEQIRVRARDGEEVTMSREVARLAGHLKDLMDDASSEDGVYPVPIVTASTLRALVRMPEMLGALRVPGAHRMEQYQNQSFEELRYEGYAGNPLSPSSDEHSLLQLMEHVEGALFLDAPMLLKHNQSVIASRVNGKNADELRALLGAGSDFDGAELEAALAESAFLPEGYEAPQQLGAASSSAPLAPLRQPSLLGVPATTDAREAALEMVDVATLCELKGVNRFWRALSRHALCSRLCRGRGQPATTHLEEITDLDVELLIEAGRPGDAALAGRMLPGLARLHGYGCVVDVAKVRAANLGVQETNHFVDIHGGGRPRGAARGDRGSFLRGAAKAALDSCISGDGEAPLKLTIAAVACAGEGVVCGIPVQHMREDTMPVMDLCNKELRGHAAMLISYLIPAMGALTMLSLAENMLREEGTKAICEALEQNKSLKELDISGDINRSNIGGSAGAKHVAKMLRVNGGLTALDLTFNDLMDEGVSAVCEAIQSNKETKLASLNMVMNRIGPVGAKSVAAMVAVTGGLTSIDLSGNQLCGIWTDDDGIQRGTYTAEGITAIADALGVNGALTSVELRGNKLGDEGWGAIFAAICGNKDSKIMSMDVSSENIGPAGVKLIAEALRTSVTGGLTSLDLSNNALRGVTRFGGTYTAEGITAIADALRVNGSLTSVELSGNKLGGEGWGAIFAAICGNKDSKIMSMDASGENIGPAGVKLIAEALRTSVTGGLTSLDLSKNALCGVYKGGTYTAEGITAIADALRVNGALTKMSLDCNMLGEEGTKAICEALEQNTTLKELDLSGGNPSFNNIGGAAGAKHVAKMLGVNGALTKIE